MTRDPDTILRARRRSRYCDLWKTAVIATCQSVENGKVFGIASRYDFNGLELDRLDEETGLWERI
jgi:hypothetical protein